MNSYKIETEYMHIGRIGDVLMNELEEGSQAEVAVVVLIIIMIIVMRMEKVLSYTTMPGTTDHIHNNIITFYCPLL